MAGNSQTPISDGHIAVITPGASPAMSAIGMSVLVVADWLVVRPADEEQGDREQQRVGVDHVAERRDDRLLVGGDEGVGHPGDSEQGDRRDEAGAQQRLLDHELRLDPTNEDDDEGRR